MLEESKTKNREHTQDNEERASMGNRKVLLCPEHYSKIGEPLQLGFAYMVGMPGFLARFLFRLLARILMRFFGKGSGDRTYSFTVLLGWGNTVLEFNWGRGK